MSDKHNILKDNGLLHQGETRSYDQITEYHNDVFNRSTCYGHGVVVMFPATGHAANIHYHVFFRNQADQLYTCIDSYIKSRGRAIKILRNHHKKSFKQPLPN